DRGGGAHHFRNAFDAVAPIRDDVERDAQVSRLANRAVLEAIPATEVTGPRILPVIVLVIEERLLQLRMKGVALLYVAHDEALNRGNGDVEFKSVVDACLFHIGDQQRIEVGAQLFRTVDSVEQLKRKLNSLAALGSILHLLDG